MLVSSGKFIFLELEQKTSQKGMPYKIVHFADPVTYQRIEYFADEKLTITVGEGAMCKFTVKPEKRGYKTEHTCIKVEAA